jgi:hypothetical protein
MVGEAIVTGCTVQCTVQYGNILPRPFGRIQSQKLPGNTLACRNQDPPRRSLRISRAYAAASGRGRPSMGSGENAGCSVIRCRTGRSFGVVAKAATIPPATFSSTRRGAVGRTMVLSTPSSWSRSATLLRLLPHAHHCRACPAAARHHGVDIEVGVSHRPTIRGGPAAASSARE